MNKQSFSAQTLAVLFAGIFATSFANAVTVLDFENPNAVGLTPMSFWQGSFVNPSARVTDQFLNLGVQVSNAALVNFGYGHAASGTNGLGGIDQYGKLDYDSPVGFSFFLSGNLAATTDYFGYSPDLAGGSGNTITLTAYAIDGSIVGQTSYIETGTFSPSSPLTISGVGLFHSVTIDQTLYNTWSGGIGIDLVRFGDLSPAVMAAPVPEPETYAMLLAGLVLLGFNVRCSSRRAINRRM